MGLIQITFFICILAVALCIFLARGNTRAQARLKHAGGQNLCEKLGYIDLPTFDVILLTICTSGFYYFYIAYTLGKKLHAHSANAKALPVLALIAAAIVSLQSYVTIMLGETIITNIARITEDTYFTIVGVMFFVAMIGNTAVFVLLLCFSFKSRQTIQKILEENEVLVPLSGFLCFIFPVFYQHYVLYNATARFAKASAKPEVSQAPQAPQQEAPQEDKLAKLEKLGQLREAGLLSEEEFQAEKKKLLA